MSQEADTETADLIGQAMAAAVEAGWTREDFDDVVDTLWTDIQRAFAKHIVDKALAEAMG